MDAGEKPFLLLTSLGITGAIFPKANSLSSPLYTCCIMRRNYLAFHRYESSHGARALSVPVNMIGCRFDYHLRKRNICLNVYFYFFALVSRQNTRFPLPTLVWFFLSIHRAHCVAVELRSSEQCLGLETCSMYSVM